MKKIDDMTIAEARDIIPQARELLRMFGSDKGSAPAPERGNQDDLPFPVGTAVYIRTAVYHACGRIEGRRGMWLDLAEASYIGSDGGYSSATERGLQNNSGAEIERVGQGGRLRVNIGMIADVALHPEPLPQETK